MPREHPSAPDDAFPDLPIADGAFTVADLGRIAAALGGTLEHLPYVLRIMLENAVRNRAALHLDRPDLARLAGWRPGNTAFSIPLRVSRVLLPDSSGIPALLDLAALRSALDREGVGPEAVNPQIPVDLVVDHSLIVEQAGHPAAAAYNVAKEFERNAERYRLLKWAQQAFRGLRVVPPGMGIVHQVHIERLAEVLTTKDGRLFPEFVLGGDSHTPMVGGVGVLGWGVGGIEAEAAILGQPYMVRIDAPVGVRLSGRLAPGTTTTDLALAITERLRQERVVGQYVEFIGEGAAALGVADRATIANMAPEYGATVGFFPIDDKTITYLHETGRDPAHVARVEAGARAMGLFREAGDPEPAYSRLIPFDIGAVVPSLAGPRRPQDRIALPAIADGFRQLLTKPAAEGGFAADPALQVMIGNRPVTHGVLAIAAITSCTNTSNPGVMLGAGIMARKAASRGLHPPAYVKTSLAPGSRVVTRYLEKAGLMPFLEQCGFHVVGYGCTTCSGKSGGINPALAQAVEEEGLVTAAILSGNRNFAGRIHRQVRANYLASPMLVFAFALAGHIDIDLVNEPLGMGHDDQPVYLADIWPSAEDYAEIAHLARDPALYRANYATLFDGTEQWDKLDAAVGPLYPFAADSTYIVEPPFFTEHQPMPDHVKGARLLGLFGDSLTTDHITPAGEIAPDSEAGRYLLGLGVEPPAFNAFTQRRGNHEVMIRGTFANPRTRNLLVPDQEGGVTRLYPAGDITTIYAAAMAYRQADVPLIVIGGRDYGMGSSRDWAAKGTALLGVKAVIAESYERIHRSNLVALGVVPLRFLPGVSWKSLGLSGAEQFDIDGLANAVRNRGRATVRARDAAGQSITFEVEPVIEAEAEIACLAAGGMFAEIHDRLLASKPDTPTPSSTEGIVREA